MINPHPARRTRGFTLIELVVAIAIFAVLAVFAYQGLRNFLIARSGIEAHDREFHRLTQGFGILQQDLEGAVARPVRDALGDPLPALEGSLDATQVLGLTQHTAWAPSTDLISDLRRVEYRLDQGRLVRRIWTVLDRLPNSTYTERVVLDDVSAVEIRYFDREWLAAWPRARGAGNLAQLPRAVSIEVVFADGRAIKRLFLLANAG